MIDFTTELGRKAQKHLADEYFVWLTSLDSHLTPQPRPVWFIWQDGAFIIFSQAKAHKLKHIAAHPQVSLHFNTPDAKGEEDVIVFSGKAEVVNDIPSAHVLKAYIEKYGEGISGLGSTAEQFGGEYSVAIRITPTSLRGW